MTSRSNWPAIFSGTFVFLAIETTFGLLAGGIFGDSHAPGLGWGLGIWMIVLTVISFGVAAKAVSHFSAETSALNATYQGMTMFGLTVFTSVLIGMAVSMSGPVMTMGAFIDHNAWWLFVSFFLGLISAAMAGRPSERAHRISVEERGAIRPAA